MGQLGATWAQVFTRTHREDVSFREVKIKIPDRKYDLGMWMTSCTGSVRGGFWGIWEKWVSWVPGSEEDGWLSGPHVLGGGDGKVSIEICCLSPYVEKPLNSKVIKSFVPELRSRKCFSCFVIPMFNVRYIWVMNILCTYHIFIYLVMLQECVIESRWIHAFLKGITMKSNENRFVQDLNSGYRFHSYKDNGYLKHSSNTWQVAIVLVVNTNP